VENDRNWAGNYRYSAKELLIPETVEQIQERVAHSRKVKALGSRHSFNSIADCEESLISLEKLNRVIALDPVRRKVTVEAGVRYGDLCIYLHGQGFALHNMASLPHITVAGACATATHGSGDKNGNLATAVHGLEVVRADGEIVEFSRDRQDGLLDGAVVGLGGLGIVTKVTLDLIPAFEMSQTVYENLSLDRLGERMDDVFSGAYSVSLFTNWRQAGFNQVWLKRRAADSAEAVDGAADYHGATPADAHRHPVPGHASENCTEQQGIPGPWHERLPHFRLDFTPSAGKELQSEYFVPREHAYAALCAIDRIRDRISPHLRISEIRTIAGDRLWMSPCCGRDSVAIHFTWQADWEGVRQVLPAMEEQLEPYGARPHWGKLFTMSPGRVKSLYEKLPDFRRLLLECDPGGKFRNDFMNQYIWGE
jgi:xylitol oxidase